MLRAHISICLDCFPFYLLRICSLFCVLKKKFELYNSISESHHCNISDVYILIFFFSQRVGHDCISNEVLPSFTALSPADFLNLLNLWPPPFPLSGHDRNFRETTLPMNNHCDSEIFFNTCFFSCKAHIHMYNVIVCFVHAICMFVICSVHQTHGFKFRLIRNGMDLHFNMDFKDHYQVCNWQFRSFKVIQIYTIFY